MGIPNIDFEVSLNRELGTIRAAGPEAEAYVHGVRRGSVRVFATGSNENVDIATKIMNRHGSLELENLSGRESLPVGVVDENVTPIQDDSLQTGRVRRIAQALWRPWKSIPSPAAINQSRTEEGGPKTT
jgi:hypothetical protein